MKIFCTERIAVSALVQPEGGISAVSMT